MPHYLTLRFDITGLSSMQIERLKQDAMAQAKSNRKQCKEAAAIHPNVAVDEVCHFCGQILENDECGGEGEGSCSESLCAALYKPVTKQALDVYVREFWICTESRTPWCRTAMTGSPTTSRWRTSSPTITTSPRRRTTRPRSFSAWTPEP